MTNTELAQELNKRNIELEVQLSQAQYEIDDLEAKVRKLKNEVEALKAEIFELKVERDGYEETITKARNQ